MLRSSLAGGAVHPSRPPAKSSVRSWRRRCRGGRVVISAARKRAAYKTRRSALVSENGPHSNVRFLAGDANVLGLEPLRAALHVELHRLPLLEGAEAGR